MVSTPKRNVPMYSRMNASNTARPTLLFERAQQQRTLFVRHDAERVVRVDALRASCAAASAALLPSASRR